MALTLFHKNPTSKSKSVHILFVLIPTCVATKTHIKSKDNIRLACFVIFTAACNLTLIYMMVKVETIVLEPLI